VDLADTNFWLSLTLEAHPHHKSACRWFEEKAERHTIVFNRATQQSYLRLLTQSLGTGYQPCSLAEAWNYYDLLIEDDRIRWTSEPAGLELVWRRMSQMNRCSPKLWMDAYLAAFSVSGGYRLVTFDQAYRQFESGGLDLVLLKEM